MQEVDREYQIALHEAAHAIAAHVLGFELFRVTIFPDQSKGICIYTRSGDPTDAIWADKETLVCIAGRAVEQYLLHVEHIRGDTEDESSITRLISYIHKPLSVSEASGEEWDTYDAAITEYRALLEERVQAFVLEYETIIRALAAVLVDERTMDRQRAIEVIEATLPACNLLDPQPVIISGEM